MALKPGTKCRYGRKRREAGISGLLYCAALCWFVITGCPHAQALRPSTKISQYGHLTWRLGQAGLNGTPTAITQTTDGYIWVGTSDGLYRFDGVRFTRWTSQEDVKLPNQDIYSLLGSKDGSLYIGTGRGLARLKQGHLYVYPGGLFNIRPLIQDAQGTIWMGQRGDEAGAHVVCRVGELQISCLGNKDGFDLLGGYSLFSDKPGSVWVGNFEGIDHWRQGQTIETYRFKAPLTKVVSANAYVGAIAADEDGGLWAGIIGAGPGRGLLRFADGAWKSFDTPDVTGSKLPVRHLLAVGGALWIGTYGSGLYRLRASRLDHFGTAEGLSGDAINALFNDREGNLWTLTDSGVDVFRDLSILSLTTREGLSDDSAAAVEIAPDAAVWIGTRYALNIMRDQQISILRRGHGTPANSATVLYRDSRDTMWMTDEVGHLFRYRDGQFTVVSTESGGVDYYIWGVTEDKGGEVWLSALERGNLSHRHNALLRVQDSHIGEAIVAPDNQLMFLAPHPQGGYWAAGYTHGLFRFMDGRFEEVSPELSHEGMRLISSELMEAPGFLLRSTSSFDIRINALCG